MAQEEDFFRTEDPNIDPPGETEAPEPGKDKKGNSRSRILLLVLLLLVIVAAALFYVGPGLMTPEVARTPAAPSKKKVVKLPAPQEAPAKTRAAEKAEPSPEKGVVSEELPERYVAAVESVEDAAREKTAASAELQAAGEEAGGPETAPEVKAGPAEGVVEEPAPAPVAAGRYILQAGAYLLEPNIKSVEATLEGLGYSPRLDRQTGKIEMTRLKVGSYDRQAAQARLEDIRRLAPDAFTLKEDGQRSVYAGSFYSLDRARAFADRLYAQGLRVEEERAEVEMPITVVRFGGFADRSEAEKVASLARGKGLDVTVVEKR